MENAVQAMRCKCNNGGSGGAHSNLDSQRCTSSLSERASGPPAGFRRTGLKAAYESKVWLDGCK